MTDDREVHGEQDSLPGVAPPRPLRPAEVFNAKTGRRGAARDAAQRHGGQPAPVFDYATGKELPLERGSTLPPGRGSAFPGGNPSDTPQPKQSQPVARGQGARDAEALDVAVLRASPPQPTAPAAPPRRRPAAPSRPAPGGPRRLGLPVPVHVVTGPGGRPRTIDGDAVEAVRESWLIEDRWWTDEPLRRRYWEVVTAGGRNMVVFRDLQRGTWAKQR